MCLLDVGAQEAFVVTPVHRLYHIRIERSWLPVDYMNRDAIWNVMKAAIQARTMV